ncbi:hypothetical protein GFS24_20765 [Chitinophaga sp. SYP-B3965]|uniref:dsDNA nuclease domain-containing protein n=1 Tax=Chitinophaga sp. SYP-B3965 TaxID=2663120 RepID=UPI001299D084|nr:dsDNA nuclease domain-containing protein [Chitinophaga sp. SYP-B3965]MRG47567.1 hypothetical protein [Chitinophaga sp. SYP-B3965]
MSIYKLFLFSKDTGATATEQGFLYQKLVTLRTWLENRINKIDERIYCDLEDDIFQRDLINHHVKFRQIKLYSTNFSFTREEIQKTLAHFFMLFCKGDYMLDEVSFSFETNSGIANETRGNDGDLLNEWAAKQGSVDDVLMERVLARVKPIIDDYISSAYELFMDVDSKAALQEAKIIYTNLSDDIWRKFVRAITWKFDGVKQAVAIPQLYDEVENLVTQLPVLVSAPATSVALLLFDITKKTAEKDPERKYVTNASLDILLLNDGNEKEQWYAEVLAKWSAIVELPDFNIGAFYELVNAARFCRWEMYESGHADLWCQLLKLYIEKDDTLTVSKRKAIYEYIFLLLSPDPNTGKPGGTMLGQEDLIRYYFGEINHHNHPRDIEEDITLLQLVQAHRLYDPAFLNLEELDLWRVAITGMIEELSEKARNADDECLALELKGHMLSSLDPEIKPSEKIDRSIAVYRRIIPLLENAQTFSISRLFDQLSQILSLFIHHDADDEAIDTLESFLGEIEEAASKTGRQHDAAHALIVRGTIYLGKKNGKSFLKALELFHQAKGLWNLDETREGFVLALLNISQIYAGLGMNLAAKYYGLCAVWASTHYGDASIFKRISDGFTMVFNADFRQGSWFSALDDYLRYITFRIAVRPETLDFEKDKQFKVTSIEIAGVLALIPIIHPDLAVYIEIYKQRLGWVYEERLKELVEGFEGHFMKSDVVDQFVKTNVSGSLLNDVGASRRLCFKASGVEFAFHFENTAAANAIAEEFGALLQITLTEMGLINADFHFLKLSVRVDIVVGEDYSKFIEQEADHEQTAFRLNIPVFNGTEQSDIQYHYGFLAVNVKQLLENLSLLKSSEFKVMFSEIYTKQKLGEKGLVINTYQKVYFNLQSEADFADGRRNAFPAFSANDFSNQIPNVLPSSDGPSSKYDAADCLKKIGERYENLTKHLHLTLAKWRGDERFHKKIQGWRQAGWLDWQILMALSNYILNNKARIISGTRGADDEKAREKFEKEFFRLNDLDEADSYIDIPVDVIESPDLDFWLTKMPVDTLESFGLENGMHYPNFKAIRRLLSQRFFFDRNDLPQASPLKDD